jgi:hypothetical protein
MKLSHNQTQNWFMTPLCGEYIRMCGGSM